MISLNKLHYRTILEKFGNSQSSSLFREIHKKKMAAPMKMLRTSIRHGLFKKLLGKVCHSAWLSCKRNIWCN